MRKLFTPFSVSATQRAFTLVETVVSVAILTIAIVGPMTLSTQSIRASRDARLQLEATYLASEGIEMLHNIRDNSSADDNSLARNDWMTVSSSGDSILSRCVSGCTIDVTAHSGSSVVWQTNAIDSCATAACTRMLRNQNTGLYRNRGNGAIPGGWEDSGFARTLVATDVVSGRHIHITSTVTYTNSMGVARSVVASDDLYNWFPDLNP